MDLAIGKGLKKAQIQALTCISESTFFAGRRLNTLLVIKLLNNLGFHSQDYAIKDSVI